MKETDDLISRQAVIDIVEFECGEWVGLAKTIIKAIEELKGYERKDMNENDLQKMRR